MKNDLQTLFPGRDIEIHASDRLIGHAKIMQHWFSLLTGDFVFHCEDDWEFIRRGSPIRASLDVLSADSSIGQVCFAKRNNKAREKTASGTVFGKLAYEIQKSRTKDGPSRWPKFTLNPSIIRVEAMKKVGNFEDRTQFEYHYGLRWIDAQFETAFLDQPFVRHLGHGRSAYAINGTTR